MKQKKLFYTLVISESDHFLTHVLAGTKLYGHIAPVLANLNHDVLSHQFQNFTPHM